MSEDWGMGTILERGRERVMFVAWDKMRDRMGGGVGWFVAIRLTRGITEMHRPGEVVNYQRPGFKVVEETLDG
jgi:hypothetical protein